MYKNLAVIKQKDQEGRNITNELQDKEREGFPAENGEEIICASGHAKVMKTFNNYGDGNDRERGRNNDSEGAKSFRSELSQCILYPIH